MRHESLRPGGTGTDTSRGFDTRTSSSRGMTLMEVVAAVALVGLLMGSALGVGCSDPYGSGLNGSQNGLGPRYEVNPHTGVFPYPYTSPGFLFTDSRTRQAASRLTWLTVQSSYRMWSVALAPCLRTRHFISWERLILNSVNKRAKEDTGR